MATNLFSMGGRKLKYTKSYSSEVKIEPTLVTDQDHKMLVCVTSADTASSAQQYFITASTGTVLMPVTKLSVGKVCVAAFADVKANSTLAFGRIGSGKLHGMAFAFD